MVDKIVLLIFSFIMTGFTQHDAIRELSDTNNQIHTFGERNERDLYIIDINELDPQRAKPKKDQKVQIKLFYECLCPDCIKFDTTTFKKAILKLGEYLDISTYPYGNAETTKDKDGRITFKCQHGPVECYGNKLHACALDIVTNRTQALLYNSCMMEPTQGSRGSDDQAAERCALRMQFDPEPIKSCAKGSRGVQLLYQYGEESRKINYNYVPYILVNEKVSDEDNFIKDICDAIASPPPQCLQY